MRFTEYRFVAGKTGHKEMSITQLATTDVPRPKYRSGTRLT